MVLRHAGLADCCLFPGDDDYVAPSHAERPLKIGTLSPASHSPSIRIGDGL